MEELSPLDKLQKLESLALHRYTTLSGFKRARYIPISSQVHEYRMQQQRRLNLYKRMRNALEAKENKDG